MIVLLLSKFSSAVPGESAVTGDAHPWLRNEVAFLHSDSEVRRTRVDLVGIASSLGQTSRRYRQIHHGKILLIRSGKHFLPIKQITRATKMNRTTNRQVSEMWIRFDLGNDF